HHAMHVSTPIACCKSLLLGDFFAVVSRKPVFIAIDLWMLAGGYGLHALRIYRGHPSATGQTPDTWPRNELIAPSFEKPQLVMFAHPRCPCTKASLGELELLAARAQGRFE